MTCQASVNPTRPRRRSLPSLPPRHYVFSVRSNPPRPSGPAMRGLALLVVTLFPASAPVPDPVRSQETGAKRTVAAPAEDAPRIAAEITVEVLRVIDGDTLEVRLEGEPVTLRLLSVDTEEKITGRASSSPSKPETVFGEETAQWAKAFFAALGSPPRVGLAFPEGRRLDSYGRLLCHVLLPDGRDYNLLLVEQGRSPYFNKYGNSLVEHQAFERAQAAARAAELGIWNPATNRARTPGAPSAVRPYERLLPWWDARAAAIEGFRAAGARSGSPPESNLCSAEDPAALARACELCRRDPAARV